MRNQQQKKKKKKKKKKERENYPSRLTFFCFLFMIIWIDTLIYLFICLFTYLSIIIFDWLIVNNLIIGSEWTNEWMNDWMNNSFH